MGKLRSGEEPAYKKKQQATKERRHKTEQDQEYIRAIVAVSTTIDRVVREQEARREQTERHEKGKHNRESTTIWVIGATALVATLTLIVTHCDTLHAIREGRQAAQGQHADTMRILEEARRQADAAQKSLVASQRPILYIKGDGNVISEGTGLDIDVDNIGNSTATNVSIFAELRRVEVNGPAIDYRTIGCQRKGFSTFGTQSRAILPKRDEVLRVYVYHANKSLKDFAPRYFQPYVVGCIQYGWLTGTDRFRTYFVVDAKIVDIPSGRALARTASGEPELDPSYPERNIGLSVEGGRISYLGVE